MKNQEEVRRRAVESEAEDLAHGVRAGHFTLADIRAIIAVPEPTAALLAQFFETLTPADRRIEYVPMFDGEQETRTVAIYPARPDDLVFRQEVSDAFERLMAAGS